MIVYLILLNLINYRRALACEINMIKMLLQKSRILVQIFFLLFSLTFRTKWFTLIRIKNNSSHRSHLKRATRNFVQLLRENKKNRDSLPVVIYKTLPLLKILTITEKSAAIKNCDFRATIQLFLASTCLPVDLKIKL